MTPDSVSCPDALNGEAGSTVRCNITTAGTTYGATVTSKGVENGAVDFNIQIDETPSS